MSKFAPAGRPSVTASQPPVQVGEHCELSISDIAFGGEGVGRIHDLVVFVPFVLVGETVRVEIIEVKRQFARARLLEVLTRSGDRVEPVCPFFGECGGCQYQHIDYPRQLQIKHKQVADLFERIGGFSPDLVRPVLPCPSPYGYRNRIMIRSQWNKYKKGLNLGFLQAQDRLVVDIDRCAIAEPAVSDQIAQARRNPPPRGGIKVTLRMLPDDWEVPRDSFFQNNFHLLPQLVATAGDCLKRSGARHLVDAYCGVGFFGISLADKVESFVGIEIDAPAIQAAQHNAARRNVTNGEFLLGATEELLPELLQRLDPRATAVILDPPRRGCAPDSLRQLRQLQPAQIVHVSCHPATLARDLKTLCADGIYELVGVTPLDMFPQTQHVECVADLRAASERSTSDTATWRESNLPPIAP